MLRRFLVALFRRVFVLFLLVCLGCSAQPVSNDLSVRVERQVRSYYKVPSDVKISMSPMKGSEFPNYDSFTITFDTGSKQQQYDFLLSKDGKTLVRLTKLDMTKDPYAEVMNKIDVSGRPTRGNKDAKVVAVNYDDFECPYCSRMHQNLFPGLLKEYGDRVLFVYKDFPLSEIHPWASRAAVDANCLAMQNTDAYWSFADYVHANQAEINKEKGKDAQFAAVDRLVSEQGKKSNLDSAKLDACIKAQQDEKVKASLKEGESLGVEATPTLFINGEKVDGAVPVEQLRAVLDRALQQAGVTPPPHPATPSPAGAASPSAK
jgi:protein-disulfide isomerase